MISALLASGGLLQDLGINPVVVATQVVVFVITFLLLSRILFGRALGFMLQREEEIRKSHDAVAHGRAEVERMTKEYEAHLAKVDKEAYDKTQALLREALAESQGAVAKAQTNAKAQVEKALAEIAQSKKDNLTQLRSQVAKLTVDVVEKVLDTKLDAGAQAAAQKYVQERS
ncbi:MAG TPA: ATP synthase F0 subunit B [Planctomycetota bacterium]|nr:ATP synthase F0 subunit B [Planctomycetota bacterium]